VICILPYTFPMSSWKWPLESKLVDGKFIIFIKLCLWMLLICFYLSSSVADNVSQTDGRNIHRRCPFMVLTENINIRGVSHNCHCMKSPNVCWIKKSFVWTYWRSRFGRAHYCYRTVSRHVDWDVRPCSLVDSYCCRVEKWDKDECSS